MNSSICSVRVQLPRPLFRKLMAQSILERTDLSKLVVRAIRNELPPECRVSRRMGKARAKGAAAP